MAKQIRELQAAPKEHAGPIKDLSAQLNRVVSEAFAARQQLHQAEAAHLQQRLAGIDQTLKTRERLSKEIIDRRVKIMEAEGIPPEDVLPSSETVARVRALADEAYRRHDEITAEEAAQQSAS